jgi:Tol biopolymer transport system component/predicted Ser/Thr protein kinase
MPLAPGTRLGPCEILAPLGTGGMGEVYRARDTKLDRDVAIKVLPAALAQDPERLARFEREAKVLASLNHPNIAQIYGIEERALIMELVDGATLQGSLPLETVLDYARQIADALEAAHDKNIIHRDLKPANIMITPAGVVKVLDFGLAAVLSRDREGAEPANSPTLTISPTRAGMILGTAAYMSPEQARGKPVDKRADIWAFGVVLFEMLTGKPLFEGETVSDTLAQVLTKEPDWEQVPAKLRRLLQACLQKDPRQRLQAIGDWKLMLTDVQQLQVAAPSQSRFGWIAAAALALALVVALWAPWRAANSVDRPLMRLDVSLGPDAIPGANSSVAISPDGTRVVFQIRGADGKPQLATRLLDQAAITSLPGTENGFGVFFSPDGQWIGFAADSKLKKVSLRGGAPVTLTDASNFLGASWGENGDIVASLNVVGGLVSIPASGESPHAVTNLGKQEGIHFLPQVLPGGNAVLFTAAPSFSSLEQANVQVVVLKTGAVKTLLTGGDSVRYLATNGTAGHLVYLHQGVLYAVAFDPVRLEVRGSPEQILEDVASTRFDVSQTGTLVYHAGIAIAQKWPVVLMDSSGKTEPLVTTPGDYSSPQFSPDGKRLALDVDTGKGHEIFVYDRQRDALTHLTFAGGSGPVWSPDGEHLVFPSTSAATSRLNWIRADGSGEVQVLLESKDVVLPSGFSPDGRRLAYLEGKLGGETDLWTLPLDTSDREHPKPAKPAPFLQTPATQAWLVFSPDGRYVAYFSNESGPYEVYVRPAPGPDGKPGPGKWQISTGGGVYPEWSPNGRELFYRSLGSRIMVTDYTATTGGSFSWNKPRMWSDRQTRSVGASLSYALAPDGKHFAVFPPPEPTAEDRGAGHVTFLLNFFDELRRKVPVGK